MLKITQNTENRETQGARGDPKGGREGEQTTQTSNERDKTIMYASANEQAANAWSPGG